MTTYTVTKVRKKTSSDGKHRHLEGVITDGGTHYTRKEVVDSISAGNTWKTSADGYSATIRKLSHCPHGACIAAARSVPPRAFWMKDDERVSRAI